MNLIDLTQMLIRIPSYLDSRNNEAEIGQFIADYLQQFEYLQVHKQHVEGNRFNIIAHDDFPPQLMFCCHMDTVPPSGEWTYGPFDSPIVDGHLYGLGAVDMKGGIACLLHALNSTRATKGLYLLFSVDEEYYFKGMTKFLEIHEVRPQLAIFPEPGLSIQHGHRGLIEIYFRVRGRSAHAAVPSEGKNAVIGAVKAVEHLLEKFKEFSNSALGNSVCNLAWLRGGIDCGENSAGQLIIEERGNKIPDIAEVVLDIRPAVPEVRADMILDILDEFLESEGYKLERAEKRLDYGSFLVSKANLDKFATIVQETLPKANFTTASNFGYGEAQLLNEKYGTNCVYFGPGTMEMAHKVDENVKIEELEKVSEIFRKLIDHYCAT